jgi:putative membrane protein
MNLKLLAWLSVFFLFMIWSAINPADRLTWWLEVLPAMIGLMLLTVTRHRFPLTPLLSVLVLIHSVILMVGGNYTYAEVPIGDWVQNLTGGERNNYDKLGHFAQGFIPAIIAREILVRNQVVQIQSWLAFIVVSICLAFSAFYELLEWAAAMVSKEGAESFLGTQGYIWDTQSDMLWALWGAMLALFSLSGLHDRQMNNLENRSV